MVRESAGWSRALMRSRKVRTPEGRELGNAQAGRPDGKCHRKGNRPPVHWRMRYRQARVKRWGKSPPAVLVTGRLGKPLPEQGQIGADAVARSARGSGRPLEAAGNGGPRWMTTARCEPGTGSGLQAGSLPPYFFIYNQFRKVLSPRLICYPVYVDGFVRIGYRGGHVRNQMRGMRRAQANRIHAPLEG